MIRASAPIDSAPSIEGLVYLMPGQPSNQSAGRPPSLAAVDIVDSSTIRCATFGGGIWILHGITATAVTLSIVFRWRRQCRAPNLWYDDIVSVVPCSRWPEHGTRFRAGLVGEYADLAHTSIVSTPDCVS